MNRAEVLTVKVHLLDTQTVEGAEGRAVMIRFDGKALGPLFQGTIVTDGTDTQFFPREGAGTLSARYLLEGTDFTGRACRIWIENNGQVREGEPIETTPRILTDSEALAFLETGELSGGIESLEEEGWLLIHLYLRGDWSEEELRLPHHGREIYGVLRRPAGAGRFPAVVLSHGFGGCHEDFGALAALLTQMGYVTYCFDFCGGSPRAKSTLETWKMTLHTEQEDLLAIVAALEQDPGVDPERLFLLGGSQGGMVSALAAEALGDRIRGMVLLFPAFCIPEHWCETYYPAGKEIPETFDFWGVTLGRAFVEDLHAMDREHMLGTYRGPVRICHGDVDKIVDLSYSQKALTRYQNAELIVYPGEGHGFGKEADCDFMGKVLQFLRAHG